jgi:hypothetical protein
MPILEKVAHVCLIGVSLVAVYVLVEQRVISGPATRNSRSTVADFKGKRINLPGAAWRTNNVVLAITSHCRYCIQSMPLYQKLSLAVSKRPNDSALFVLSFEPADDIKAFLAKEQVTPTQVLQTQFNSLGVTSTPTMLLVDNRGVVLDAMIGALPADKEPDPVRFLEGHR